MRRCAILLILAMSTICFGADALPTVESAQTRGLIFLARQQKFPEGSFGTGNARLLSTSRALLVFLQAGNVPDSGRYGTAVKTAENFLLDSVLPAGGFTGSDGRTRNQAAAVLALAQLYGVETIPERRGRILAALRLAVGPLLAAQVPVQTPARVDIGGWGDEKNAGATMPLTAITVVALSAARDVGIAIPAASFEQAHRFILACGDAGTGGFGPNPGKGATVDATAAALVTLDVLSLIGEDNARIDAAAKYLEKQPAEPASNPGGYIGGAWLSWCDARLQLPATQKLQAAYTQRLLKLQDTEGAWNPPTPATTRPDATTPTRLATTELALIGITARHRSTPVLRH